MPSPYFNSNNFASGYFAGIGNDENTSTKGYRDLQGIRDYEEGYSVGITAYKHKQLTNLLTKELDQ